MTVNKTQGPYILTPWKRLWSGLNFAGKVDTGKGTKVIFLKVIRGDVERNEFGDSRQGLLMRNCEKSD